MNEENTFLDSLHTYWFWSRYFQASYQADSVLDWGMKKVVREGREGELMGYEEAEGYFKLNELFYDDRTDSRQF